MAVLEQHHLMVSKQNGTLPRVPFLRMKEAALGASYELSVRFVGPALARRLNREQRGKDYTPDTLAFPLSPTSGEIVMCEQALRKGCAARGMPYRTFVMFLFIHSCLHLEGYAHGSTMERKEKRLLKLFT